MIEKESCTGRDIDVSETFEYDDRPIGKAAAISVIQWNVIFHILW